MINKKSREEIKLMRQAGNIVALVHAAMKDAVKEGVTTKELDELAFKIIKENKADPTFLGYHGFPGTICASINEQVVHGIPSNDIILKNGGFMKFSAGLQLGRASLIDCIIENKEHISEVYFSWGDFANGRNNQLRQTGLTPSLSIFSSSR